MLLRTTDGHLGALRQTALSPKKTQMCISEIISII